jgi:hypothetical protein
MSEPKYERTEVPEVRRPDEAYAGRADYSHLKRA